MILLHRRAWGRVKGYFSRFAARSRDALAALLTGAYVAIALAGLSFMIAAPLTVQNASATWQVYVWATFLLLGGLVSCSDMFTGLRGGELFGTLPIAGALSLWASALLWREWHNEGIAGPGTGLAWILIGFSLLLVARFIMMLREIKAAKAALPLG